MKNIVKNNKAIIILLILIMAGFGINSTLKAAGLFTSFEVESGTLVTGATTGNDASASGGSYVQFNAPTPTPSPTPTPPPTGFILKDATNTGLAGAGISEASLVNQGGITYGTSFNGQTISGKRFTGQVTITGSNITLDGNLWEQGGSSSARFVQTSGSNIIIKNSTMRTSSGSIYQCVYVTGGSVTLDHVNIEECVDLVSFNGGSGHNIRDSYLHNPSNASDSAAHIDTIEVYGGANITVERNTLLMALGPTGVLNVAPWSGGSTVTNLTVQDNYIDAGQAHFYIDAQVANPINAIQYTRIVRNRFGGHCYGGACSPYLIGFDYEGRGFVETEAALQSAPTKMLFPNSDSNPDRNIFYYSVNNPFGLANLSPDRTGQTATTSFWD